MVRSRKQGLLSPPVQRWCGNGKRDYHNPLPSFSQGCGESIPSLPSGGSSWEQPVFTQTWGDDQQRNWERSADPWRKWA